MAPTADLNNLLTKKCNTVTIGSLILARVYSFIYILGLLPKSYHYIHAFNKSCPLAEGLSTLLSDDVKRG